MATLSTFFDMVYVNATETSGYGPFTLGSAVTGFQTAAAAGIANGTPVSYKATDGTNWETAHGVIDVSGSTYTLTRGVDIIKSSNSNALVNFGSGVVVCLTELSQDFVSPATYAFMAVMNGTDQTGIPSASTTKVNLAGTPTLNQGTYWNTSTQRWVPPAGLVNLTGQIYASGGVNAGTNFIAFLNKNGATTWQPFAYASSGGSVAVVGWSIWDHANGTDYYELYVYGVTSSSITLYGTPPYNQFSGVAFANG